MLRLDRSAFAAGRRAALASARAARSSLRSPVVVAPWLLYCYSSLYPPSDRVCVSLSSGVLPEAFASQTILPVSGLRPGRLLILPFLRATHRLLRSDSPFYAALGACSPPGLSGAMPVYQVISRPPILCLLAQACQPIWLVDRNDGSPAGSLSHHDGLLGVALPWAGSLAPFHPASPIDVQSLQRGRAVPPLPRGLGIAPSVEESVVRGLHEALCCPETDCSQSVSGQTDRTTWPISGRYRQCGACSGAQGRWPTGSRSGSSAAGGRGATLAWLIALTIAPPLALPTLAGDGQTGFARHRSAGTAVCRVALRSRAAGYAR